jgi:hypothetical protein
MNGKPVDAGIAVDMFGSQRSDHQGPRATGMDRHVLALGQFADEPRIALRQFDRDIPGDRRHRKNADGFGRGKGEQEIDRIVLTGIAIDDDRYGGMSGSGI